MVFLTIRMYSYNRSGRRSTPNNLEEVLQKFNLTLLTSSTRDVYIDDYIFTQSFAVLKYRILGALQSKHGWLV